MRITNSMISRNMLTNLNNNLSRLSELERQVTSGKRISKLSDDPIGAVNSMQLRSKLDRLSQYSDNVQSAREYLQEVETSVMEMNSIVKKAYEIAVNLANDYNAEDRDEVAKTISQYRDHILDLGNGKFVDSYMFGGYNATAKPFALDESGNLLYNGISVADQTDPNLVKEGQDSLEYQVGPGMTIEVGFNGLDLMGTGEDNVYTLLNNFYNALMGDADAEEISSYAGKLLESQDRILSNAAEIGGRTNRLTLIANRYSEDTANFKQMQSNNDDVDITEAIVSFFAARTVYNYALQVGAQTMSTSLLDFLR